MSQAQESKSTLVQPDLFQVEDLDQFVQILTVWHAEKCAAVQHLLTVPEGSTFEIEGKETVLVGSALDAFKLGIEMTMMQLGSLPFVAEMEDEPAPAATGG